MSMPFKRPQTGDVINWYKWLFEQEHASNPFHPTDVQRFWENDENEIPIWKEEMADEGLIWLAGVIATTEPAKKPSQIQNITAIVSGSQATAVYNDGDGNPKQKLPPVTPRKITIDEDDNRDLFLPVSTELAFAIKYPKLVNNLGEVAQQIIDREDVNGAPPAFVEFIDAQNGKHTLDGNQLKEGFRINGAINNLNVPPDNVAMLPSGDGPAAFSDYSVVVKREALKPGTNVVRFGVNGKFFSYKVEYNISIGNLPASGKTQQNSGMLIDYGFGRYRVYLPEDEKEARVVWDKLKRMVDALFG